MHLPGFGKHVLDAARCIPFEAAREPGPRLILGTDMVQLILGTDMVQLQRCSHDEYAGMHA